MTGLEQALVRLARMLSEHQIPYMIIGGMANAIWGEPRSTLDIDATVWVEDEKIGQVVLLMAGPFRPIPEHPQQFIRETRVLPLETEAGLRIDLIFGLLQYEREAIDSAREMTVAGSKIRFCTPEDLILHKIISERLRDLDLTCIQLRIHEHSHALERPEIPKTRERKTDGVHVDLYRIVEVVRTGLMVYSLRLRYLRQSPIMAPVASVQRSDIQVLIGTSSGSV